MTETLVQESSGYAVLQQAVEESTKVVSGVAIGEGDVTRGQSGILKRWPREALEDAAETLEDKPIVIDHINSQVEKIRGQITKAGFKPGVGVIFEGEVENDDIADKIENGWLDVSPRILHEPVEEMAVEGDEDNDDAVHVVGEIQEFVNLSLVTRGAAPSNEITVGEHEELSSEAVMGFVQQAIGDSLNESASVDISDSVDVSVDVSVPSEGLSEGYSDLLSNIEFGEGDTPSESEESAENENSPAEELQEGLEVHEPEWTDTREAPWNEPSLEDFTDESWDDLAADEKQQVSGHFLVSKTGFPPENFGDLSLPVVDAENNLVLNALQNAKARAGQVSGLSGDNLEQVENLIDQLANENYEDADFGNDEENSMNEVELEVEEAGLHTFRMSEFDIAVSEDEANSVENSLSGIDGVDAVAKSDDDNPEIIVVVDPDEVSGDLNDEIRAALDDTPFVVRDGFDWVDRVVRNEGDRLAESDSEIESIEFLGDDDPHDEESTKALSEVKILN